VHTVASGEPYAMVRSSDKGFTTSGGSDDWDQVKAAKRVVQGDFLWFREGGKAYYIQDPAVMAKAHAAWAPVDKLGKQMDVHDKEMSKVSKKVEALGEQMNKAAQGAGAVDEGAMRHLEGDMHASGEEMQALHAKLRATSDAEERERIEHQIKQVADRIGELGKRIAQAHNTPQVRKSRAEMEAIGKKMSEASKPMSALGKRMGELGVQMEQASKAADLATRGLIRDARARGLARPVPAAG
jgi:predicted  nucleic acid-binding Zn-ribbon protein